jgi:hypothetical protein
MPVSGVSARGGENDPSGVGGGGSVGGTVGVASAPGVGSLLGLSIGAVGTVVDVGNVVVAVATCVGGVLGCGLGVDVALVQATTSAAISDGRATRHFV